MKKILLSIGSIVFVVALLAGTTGAFLSDTETSTGNTFATGVIDLKVDNESYVTNDLGQLVYSSSTSWGLSSLPGKLFFNFNDIKPGDIGEDTISLHVNNNNAYACMNVNLTNTPENGQPEPEALVDQTTGVNDGELQNNLYFAFWADDGDNVYEQGEKIFKQGLTKDIFNGVNWPLSDSQNNIWTGPANLGPIAANSTKYIGKVWCFGGLTETPVAQGASTGLLVRGTGFTCTGESIGNIVQSDGIKVDVSFSVAQSRNNGNFLCTGNPGNPPPPPPPPPTHTSTFMADNFEGYTPGNEWDEEWPDGSSNFDWDEVGGVKFKHVSGNPGQLADLNADANNASVPNHAESLTATYIDTQGYGTIVLKYDRKTDDTNSPPQAVGTQSLKVEFSVNDGASWTTLETVNGESPWTSKTFSLSPSADNKPRVKFRFTLTGADNTNHAYIDNVSIVGTSL